MTTMTTFLNLLLNFPSKRLLAVIACAGFMQLLPAASAQEVPALTYTTAPDGVRIAIQEYGTPTGPEIVLVHGLAGSHLDWTKQVSSPALHKYRLITYDLRGHGLSAKPSEAAYYAEGKRWGEELHTVIKSAHLTRPVLVGWSLGGVVMTNYLETYGDADIAGLVYVDGVIELKPELLKSHPDTIKALLSLDLNTYLEGTRQFVRQCFYHQPDAPAFALLYANAAMASPDMMRTVFAGVSAPAASALPRVGVPTLYIYGEQDNLVGLPMTERAKQLMPRSTLILYPKTGHAVFFEQPGRFNQDLDRFARQTKSGGKP